MELRPYQQEAVSAIYTYLRQEQGNPCCVIPTGGGKTPVLAQICSDAVTKWHGRVLIVSHVKELLEQAKDKLNLFCQGVPIGIYSAGLGERTTDTPVVVAGIQSVYRKAEELGVFNLIIIDECHLIPNEGDGMYRQFLADMKAIDPGVRLIGLTATPYRLSSGWLCGKDNLLNDVCYEVGVRELILQGYLSPLVARGNRHKIDFSKVHIRGGEYAAEEIAKLVDTEKVVYEACSRIVEQATDRKKVLVFAADVLHAKNVQKSLAKQSGEEVGLVTGDTPILERNLILRRFKGEKIAKTFFENDCYPPLKYLVNVNVLTTGFDNPSVDCIAILRPTQSPGLYVQMVGRGLRKAEEKTDCLILDFGENVARHGPIDMINIAPKTGRHNAGESPAKECPQCQRIIHSGFSKCPECGYDFTIKATGNHDSESSDDTVVTPNGKMEYTVQDIFYFVHTKKGADPDTPKTMRVEYQVDMRTYKKEWVCVEHSGFARQRFVKWWQERSNAPLPETAAEAVAYAQAGFVARATRIVVERPTGEKYERITKYDLEPVPEYSELAAIDMREDSCGNCVNYFEGVCLVNHNERVSPDLVPCPLYQYKNDVPF